MFRTRPNSVKTVIDAAALASGMYLIEINQNGEVTSRKVLK
ncbi:T9SS type A sorting domain-containing protein [Kaistella sp. DKR-2]|nr:T9SS type A sorting domain-containing protein [Kaistella soli]